MVYKIENSEIADCWEDLVKLVYTNGHLVDDERGSTTKELLNVVTKIKNPLGKQDGGFFGIDPCTKDIGREMEADSVIMKIIYLMIRMMKDLLE